MKIQDPKLQFESWLELASFRAINFGQNYIKQKLSYNFNFELQLNMANDDLAIGGFEKYPEDEEKVIQYETIDEVAKELVRNGKIPVWIDISTYKFSKESTTLRLICAGRYTDETNKLYYYERGTGCFGVKGPDLPYKFKKGSKFKLQKA